MPATSKNDCGRSRQNIKVQKHLAGKKEHTVFPALSERVNKEKWIPLKSNAG